MYSKGEGVGQDINEARKWFELAAKQGHKDAQTILKSLRIPNRQDNKESKGKKEDKKDNKQDNLKESKDNVAGNKAVEKKAEEVGKKKVFSRGFRE